MRRLKILLPFPLNTRKSGEIPRNYTISLYTQLFFMLVCFLLVSNPLVLCQISSGFFLFILFFILLSFATKTGSPQQHVSITVGPQFLNILILVREENRSTQRKPSKHRTDQRQGMREAQAAKDKSSGGAIYIRLI